MENMVRWGILGTAGITRRRFLPALAKSHKSRVVAVGSRDRARAEEFAKEFGIPKAHGSYQGVLDAPEVEVVYVPLPNHMHAEWTMRAADAGKHVLCEKPMACDAAEALAMVERAEKNGVLLMEGFMYRLNPRTLLAREVIESGIIGELRTIVLQFSFTIGPAQGSRLIPGKGAGALLDLGCYCVNVSRYLFGAEPVSALAAQHLHPEIGCDMTTSAILKFDGGRESIFNCSFQATYRASLEAVGTLGIMRVDRFVAPPTEGKLEIVVETSDSQVHRYETDAVDQFLVETDHFADCVRGAASPILNPRADAIPNARVIDAIRKSAGNRSMGGDLARPARGSGCLRTPPGIV